MKIEIDVYELLGGKENAKNKLYTDLRESIHDDLFKIIREMIEQEVRISIKKVIETELTLLFKEGIDLEYTPTDNYGYKKEKTTFRAEAIKVITKQMTFKDNNYASDNNLFTNAVISCMKSAFDDFSKQFRKTVDAQFTEKCLIKAQEFLREKMGLSKETKNE